MESEEYMNRKSRKQRMQKVSILIIIIVVVVIIIVREKQWVGATYPISIHKGRCLRECTILRSIVCIRQHTINRCVCDQSAMAYISRPSPARMCVHSLNHDRNFALGTVPGSRQTSHCYFPDVSATQKSCRLRLLQVHSSVPFPLN